MEDDGDDEMLLGADEGDVLPTTEHHSDGFELRTTELPYSPKRRKIDADSTVQPDDDDGASHPTFKPPPDPSTLRARFAPPSSRAQTPATDTRPTFLRPSTETSTEPPLPEAFSPHRRGQKFVPGGMAATVQQWVVETGQASRRGRGSEEFAVKVRVDDVVGGEGPCWLVRGKSSVGEDVRLILAGGGGVEVGVVVGVRAPTWEVEVEGRRWRVAVDWRVL